MPIDIIQLSKRIAKLRPNPDGVWLDDIGDPLTGLPLIMSPFAIELCRGENYEPTGGWRVYVATKDAPGDAVLFDQVNGVFAAFRLMVDCYEAWQLIKPMERVYFIGTHLERGKLVKVGYSRDPQMRLRDLQTAHGERLQIFATVPGGKALEAKYHTRWRARRREGEWFTIGDPILAEITRLSEMPA